MDTRQESHINQTDAHVFHSVAHHLITITYHDGRCIQVLVPEAIPTTHITTQMSQTTRDKDSLSLATHGHSTLVDIGLATNPTTLLQVTVAQVMEDLETVVPVAAILVVVDLVVEDLVVEDLVHLGPVTTTALAMVELVVATPVAEDPVSLGLVAVVVLVDPVVMAETTVVEVTLEEVETHAEDKVERSCHNNRT